jgi:hypothetical protein
MRSIPIRRAGRFCPGCHRRARGRLGPGLLRDRPQGRGPGGDTAIAAGNVPYRQAVLELRSAGEVPAHLALFQLLEVVTSGEAEGVAANSGQQPLSLVSRPGAIHV